MTDVWISLFSNPWVIGIGTTVVAGIILFLLLEKRKIFTSRFSSTQFIKTLPPSLGGVDFLNLDNTATLQLYVPYDNNQITFILNKTPIVELPTTENKTFKIENFKIISHKNANFFTFSIADNIKKIKIEDRTFIVTLRKISLLDFKDVPNARKYEFGISEK